MTDTEKFTKIFELYTSPNLEDYTIGRDWLRKLIGVENADATFFVVEVCWDMESDENIEIDQNNYARMTFKTFPIRFGKDYMYTVDFKAMFKGELIVDSYSEYGRYYVADGQPKYDFVNKICSAFKKQGYELNQEIFKLQNQTKK